MPVACGGGRGEGERRGHTNSKPDTLNMDTLVILKHTSICIDKHILSSCTHTPAHIRTHTFVITVPMISYVVVHYSAHAPTTTWTKFVWGGEHHVDKVHLGRRAPRGQGSSGEGSTTWTRFIRGEERHPDEVHLGRRAPHRRGLFGKEREGNRPSKQIVANLKDQRCACVTLPTCSGDVTPPSVMRVRFNMARSVPTSE